MKKTLTLSLFIAFFLSAFFADQASAQTVLYTQNFDSSANLPTGWYATPGSWFNDTTGGNSSSGYLGASGLNNVEIQDTLAMLGNDSLITGPISTVGYDNILVEWASRFSKHFADSGSTISLYYSTNGNTWTNVSYTENANNSGWYPENDSTPIVLPAGAANAAALQLMWIADIHFAPSGTYRIDDLTVAGTSTAGINTINADQFAKVYTSYSNINISVMQPVTEPILVEVYEMTGRMVYNTSINTQTQTISGSGFSQGVYFVKLSSSNQNMTTKVLMK
jgi:hypothetical protein